MTLDTPNHGGSILIADPDSQFIDSVNREGKSAILSPFPVTSGIDAQTALANPMHRFLAVVLNPTIDKSNGVTVIRHSLIHRPATPIFVIHEGERPFAKKEQQQLCIQEIIKKPLTYSQISDRITPNLLMLDGKNTRTEQSTGEQTISAADANFTPIRAEDFLAGSESMFDLFVRLTSGRYVKILQAGEAFERSRLLTFLNKGVTSFFLEKSAQRKYVSYCDQIAVSMINSDRFNHETKIKTTMIHGEETLNFLKAQGLSQETLHACLLFIKNVELLIKKTGLNKDRRVVSLLGDFSKYDHAVSVTIVASLIGKALNFDGQRAIKLLGQAALLHDIGLVGFTEGNIEEDESKLSPEQLKDYLKHPTFSSQILAELNMDSVVIQAVEQHHERRSRNGFPNKLGAGSINKIAEIIGISEEYVKRVKKYGLASAPLILIEMTTFVFQDFSLDTSEAFCSVLFPLEK